MHYYDYPKVYVVKHNDFYTKNYGIFTKNINLR